MESSVKCLCLLVLLLLCFSYSNVYLHHHSNTNFYLEVKDALHYEALGKRVEPLLVSLSLWNAILPNCLMWRRITQLQDKTHYQHRQHTKYLKDHKFSQSKNAHNLHHTIYQPQDTSLPLLSYVRRAPRHTETASEPYWPLAVHSYQFHTHVP